jgi:hypothetical protein
MARNTVIEKYSMYFYNTCRNIKVSGGPLKERSSSQQFYACTSSKTEEYKNLNKVTRLGLYLLQLFLFIPSVVLLFLLMLLLQNAFSTTNLSLPCAFVSLSSTHFLDQNTLTPRFEDYRLSYTYCPIFCSPSKNLQSQLSFLLPPVLLLTDPQQQQL